MAHIDFTLNHEEILQLLAENRSETFRKLLEESLNAIMKAESNE